MYCIEGWIEWVGGGGDWEIGVLWQIHRKYHLGKNTDTLYQWLHRSLLKLFDKKLKLTYYKEHRQS